MRCYDYEAKSLAEGASSFEQPDAVGGPGPRRRLAGSTEEVIHTTAGGAGWSVARGEVVTALLSAEAGSTAFETLVSNRHGIAVSLQFLDLTQEGMVLSAVAGDELTLDLAFDATNRFVLGDADRVYRVSCPAHDSGTTCQIRLDAGAGLADCASPEAALRAEHIPAACLAEPYRLGLYAVPGPHFILAGERTDSGRADCPPTIAMQSIAGRKVKHAVVLDDVRHLPRHDLGAAPLDAILYAEEGATAITEGTFDAFTNNCVHYARDVWRALDIPETDALARFVTENVVHDENLLAFFKMNGSARALAAVATGGQGRLKKYVAQKVRSQFEIEGGEALGGLR